MSFGASFSTEFGDLHNTLLNIFFVRDAHTQQSEHAAAPVGGNVILKCPLLLMIDALSSALLRNLQRLAGISIALPIWIWDSRQTMTRRTVKINFNITSSYIRIVRPILKQTL